ncbi:MAG TPA: hypothetical protein VMY69_05860 [Phycisphaerae bacterium]|nr:hypothetical protein [Phycisphaerae bacterium]
MKYLKISTLLFLCLGAGLALTQDSYWIPTDHGELYGLGDNDHPQYFLADGTRAAAKLPVSSSSAIEQQALQSYWAFKYADGLGLDDTGLYFDLAGAIAGYRFLDAPAWSVHVASGDVINYGDLTIGHPAAAALDYHLYFKSGADTGTLTYSCINDEFEFLEVVHSKTGFRANDLYGATGNHTVISSLQAGGGGGIGLQYKTRTLTYSGGIITAVSAESGWIDL